MKQALKAILSFGLISFGAVLTRSLSIGITNDIALLQMQNVNYVPNLNATSPTVNFIIWCIVIIFTYMLWRKDIKKILK